MRTEELPNLGESKFSAGVIRDVAQNILSFLKGKATKEGHTYWLFKGFLPSILLSSPSWEWSSYGSVLEIGVLYYNCDGIYLH